MRRKCKHCGTLFRVTTGLKDYCCHGCEQVSQLIHSEGLDAFYVMQDEVGRPLNELPMSPVRTDWVLAEVEKAEEIQDGVPSLTLRLEGMTCMGCAWLVERIARKAPGVRAAKVSLMNSSLHLVWRAGAFDLAALVQQLIRFGYRLESGRLMGLQLSDLGRRTLLCGIFTSNVLLLELCLLLSAVDFGMTRIFSLLALLFVGLGWVVSSGSYAPAVFRGLLAKQLSHDTLLFFGSSLALLWYLFLHYSGNGILNLSSVSFFAFLLVSSKWIHADSLRSLEVEPADDLEVKRPLWIGRVDVGLSLLPILLAPVLWAMGSPLTQIWVIWAGLWLIFPQQLFYELSRTVGPLAGVMFSMLTLALGGSILLTGTLSPIGALLFNLCSGLLTVAVDRFLAKLRAT
ncbi:MAG: heavy metal translocating P-type ATPase metal-binding domain-containing protein [Verrucomicrobiota bacterium]